MPKHLVDRFQHDSIAQFRVAAHQRADEARALGETGHRTAAIYLWGYASEMMVKAAYFRLIGFNIRQPIQFSDLQAAKSSAPSLGVNGFTNLHDIRGWAELLVARRASMPGRVYTQPGYGSRVERAGRTVYNYWRETLRYRQNVAYHFELAKVESAAQWLLRQWSSL